MERLLPLVYDELRALARAQRRHERPNHTLQPTALVHEAYLRLVGTTQPSWNDRQHFFRAAAEAMRRILIDHARKRGWVKRGGKRLRVELSGVDLASDQDLGSDSPRAAPRWFDAYPTWVLHWERSCGAKGRP